MRYTDWTRAARARTEPRPEAVARVTARLDRALLPAKAELSVLPGPTDLQAARVRARLREAGVRRRRVPLWVPAAGLAAATLLLTVVAVRPWPGPEPRVDLALTGTASDVALGDHVRAVHDGRGSVAGTGRDLQIDWEVGRIELDVTPQVGVSLAVRTGEGVVTVVGTKFAVVRDALGTSVEVDRGRVHLACANGAARDVGGGEAAECRPTTASGWLRRAQALEDRGRPASEVLAAVEAGLEGGDATRQIGSELEVTRMGALLRAGRSSEALDAAERALAGAEASRTQELRRAAARLALAAGDCVRALPHLDALAAPTPDESAYRERCSRAR